MGKLLLGLAGLLALGMLVISAPGCTDSCADLQEVCDLCTDQSYLSACITTVERDNQSLCNESLANYRQFCKGGDGGASASSSTGAGGTSSAGGSGGTSSAGGSGGTSATGGSGGASSAGGSGGG